MCSCKWEMEERVCVCHGEKGLEKTDRKYKEKYIKRNIYEEKRERGYRGQRGRGGVRASREQRVFVNSKLTALTRRKSILD